MIHKTLITGFCLIILMIIFLCPGYAQDRVYTSDGKVLLGKVTEVGPMEIRFQQQDRPQGLVYVIRVSKLDSIVYSNGAKDEMRGVTNKKSLLENIPQLNTWTFDLLGFTYLSCSQSYERRIKNGWIGLRIPLYIGFIGGGFAGEGIFQPGQGVYGVLANSSGGWSIATGLNPKFYFFKRRKVRAFAGPEATIGYTSSALYGYNVQGNYYNYYTTRQNNGTLGLIGKVGLSFNPVDKLNLTIDGGAGGGDMFGPNGLGWVGLWHVGLAIGTNF